jgi:adenosine kinase
MNIVVTGTLSFDYIMDFSGRFADRIMPDKLHCLSLSFLVDKLSKQHGGTAGNIAYSMNLLGLKPLILAPAGNDFKPYKEFLEEHHLNTSYIAIHKNVSTSGYFVMTDHDDNQIGSFFNGATMYAKKIHIRDVKEDYPLVVLAPTEPSAMNAYVKECIKLKKKYLYDPAFQIGNFSASDLREGIEHAEILIGNDYEIALIQQKLELTHEELICMVPILITTLGARGSIIETRKEAIHVHRANAKNMSDPTGAGDAYRAGLLAGYLRGYDLMICGQMGSVAAAYTVEKYGTQTHTYTKKQFIARYKENFGKTLSL